MRRRRSSLKREKAVMLVSSCMVLTALTATGLYVRNSQDKRQEEKIVDFSALEDQAGKPVLTEEELAQMGELDYDPSFYEDGMADQSDLNMLGSRAGEGQALADAGNGSGQAQADAGSGNGQALADAGDGEGQALADAGAGNRPWLTQEMEAARPRQMQEAETARHWQMQEMERVRHWRMREPEMEAVRRRLRQEPEQERETARPMRGAQIRRLLPPIPPMRLPGQREMDWPMRRRPWTRPRSLILRKGTPSPGPLWETCW